MRTSKPGVGRVEEPNFTGLGSTPHRLAVMPQPVSVCHQWSTTVLPLFSPSHCCVGGSSRSPAEKMTCNFDRSYCAISFASGSSFFTARNAVGAVKNDFTPYSAHTRHNAPASGVMMGLPSYTTVVQ